MSNNHSPGTFSEKRELALMNDSVRKKRTSELQHIAQRILSTSGADVSQTVAIRPLARALAKAAGCSYRTAIRHIEWAILQVQNKNKEYMEDAREREKPMTNL